MKALLNLLLFTLGFGCAQAQDTTLVLAASMFDSEQTINLTSLAGWVYHPGNNPAWANPGLNTTGWSKRNPSELSVRDADKTGRVEGWFRLKLRLDSSFQQWPLSIRSGSWAATDVYIDGQLAASFGNSGANNQPYHEYYWLYQLPVPVSLSADAEHIIVLHLVDKVASFPQYPGHILQSELNHSKLHTLQLTGPGQSPWLVNELKNDVSYYMLWLAISLFLNLFFWLLSWLNLYEKTVIRLLAVIFTLFSLSCAGRLMLFSPSSLDSYFLKICLIILPLWVMTVFGLLTLLVIYGYQLNRRWVIGLLIVYSVGGLLDMYIGDDTLISIANVIQQIFITYLAISLRKRLKGAQWVIVVGTLTGTLASMLFGVFTLAKIPFDFNLLYTCVSLPLPIAFLIYVTLRFKEILADVQEKSSAVLRVTQEKQQLLASQNERLEQQVEQRTAELKASQAQLIQKEKLASLGELTAGIAHEIQNPLNFVNNFSEVSAELVDELKVELAKGDVNEASFIADDLSSNLQKIHHHGGRASSIVKGMLEHSRTESGERRPTDLAALADEYLKIAYHGLRAKDKSGSPDRFNCELVTHFDPTLKPVEVAPQEIGRVLLNLYNNAFYAVAERAKKTTDPDYKPTVEVSIQRQPGQVLIQVQDNGTGISESVKAKIFQPFFTTKPTGEGTGLGLSLSYDIITKGHGGTLRMESAENQGSEFIILLPSHA